MVYGNPSNALIVIGVTGTKGKSSTVQMMAQLLTACGERVGYTSTAGFAINGRVIENRMKMTMPGRFFLQRILRDMVNEGCTYAVVETSSQGLTQFRHVGVNYDVAVCTNLTPEHIESHGGFENYKAAKGMLFAHLTKMPKKVINGKAVKKISVVNADDAHAEYFASFPADRHVAFGWRPISPSLLPPPPTPPPAGGEFLPSAPNSGSFSPSSLRSSWLEELRTVRTC